MRQKCSEVSVGEGCVGLLLHFHVTLANINSDKIVTLYNTYRMKKETKLVKNNERNVILKEGNEYNGNILQYDHKRMIFHKKLMLVTNENIEIRKKSCDVTKELKLLWGETAGFNSNCELYKWCTLQCK